MEQKKAEYYVQINNKSFKQKMKEDIAFHDLYNFIDCGTVELISLTNNIDLWVDEEGLLKKNYITELKIKGFDPIRIAGIGILLSFNEEGDPKGLSLEQLEYISNNMSIRTYGEVNA